MLRDGHVATRLPAQDLERARVFYSSKLGLDPVEERPGGLRYQCGSGQFALFQSAGAASGTHTQMGWEVDDLQATVTELRRRGVVFEEYDLPGFKTVDGIAGDRRQLSIEGWKRRESGVVSRQRGEPPGRWTSDAMSRGLLPAGYRNSVPTPGSDERVPVQSPNETLAALGRTPSIVSGGRNRFAAALLSRLLSRRAAVRLMGRAMDRMYGG